MKTTAPITPKQKKVLDFIEAFTGQMGYAPSQNEIAHHFGFRSLGTVQNYLVRLERAGALTKTWNQKRSLRPLQEIHPSTQQRSKERGDVLAAQPLSSQREPLSSPSGNHSQFVNLPLCGKVAAGAPIEHVLQDEMVAVPQEFLASSGEHFVLEVQGNSMIEEGIFDQDQVVIRKQLQAENGQTVIAMIDGQATIKKYYCKNKQIELHPANPSYSTIFVNEDQSFSIAGVLMALLRKF